MMWKLGGRTSADSYIHSEHTHPHTHSSHIKLVLFCFQPGVQSVLDMGLERPSSHSVQAALVSDLSLFNFFFIVWKIVICTNE